MAMLNQIYHSDVGTLFFRQPSIYKSNLLPKLNMVFEPRQLHFLLVPLMSAGHLLPMADIGRLPARQGVIVTIATTPLNADRIKPSIDRATASGLHIGITHLQLPLLEVGLPKGCESLELIPSRNLMRNFFDALQKLQQPLEHLFNQLEPTPACILADKYLYWTENIARKFKIPRLLFDGTRCFNLLCFHCILESEVHEKIPQPQPFVVPNLPHRIELTRAQLPVDLNPESTEFKRGSGKDKNGRGRSIWGGGQWF